MRFICLKEVMHVTGLGRSSIYNYMAEGRFPKTIPLGGRYVTWIESDIELWVAEKVAARDV